METDALPPAELPFGARVRAVFTKYDGRPHWEYDLVVLGVDEHGVWVGGAPGGYISRPGREFVSDAHWVCLYPHSGMWVATINDSNGTFSSRIYVDVATPAEWWHRPDGVLSVSNVDLDLDVIRRFDGDLFVDDEDEFEQHRHEMRYPAELVEDARRTTQWLYDRLDRHEEPFAAVCESWLAVCRERVTSDARGRAVAGAATSPGAAGMSPAGGSAGDDQVKGVEVTPADEEDEFGPTDVDVDAAAAGGEGDVEVAELPAGAARFAEDDLAAEQAGGEGDERELAPASIAQAEYARTDAEEGEEDLLAVWADDEQGDRPIIDTGEEIDDGPAVEVDYDGEIEPGTPVSGEDDYTARGAAGRAVAADLHDVDDIDTSPVDPAEVTGLLLTTETGRESPLWFDGRPVEPEEVGVSAELADRLRDWADRWNRDFDPVRGWAPRAVIADYEALGRWLGRRLKDEVGGLAVTVQLAHLGRSSLEEVAEAARREPVPVTLDASTPGDLPVVGEFVTEAGTVGCFTAETNTRLAEWAQAGGTDEAEAEQLRWLMAAELGPDYRVV